MNKDIIKLNADGKEEEVELVLVVSKGNKKYLLYKNSENEMYASYILENDETLHNNLTDAEYEMLEKLYLKGANVYDK